MHTHAQTKKTSGAPVIFLREVFPLNERLEHSWNVARLDYWRWHYIQTCNIIESVEKGMAPWENVDSRIVAVLKEMKVTETWLKAL